jgi:hypothetical protein
MGDVEVLMTVRWCILAGTNYASTKRGDILLFSFICYISINNKYKLLNPIRIVYKHGIWTFFIKFYHILLKSSLS